MLLTARQRAVLEFIKNHILDKGFPPTVREVSAYFGFASPLSAQLHINSLVKKGFLKKTRSKQRSIEVLGLRPAEGLRIPLLKKLHTALPLHISVAEEIESYINVDKTVFDTDSGFALRVEGDSMVDAGIFAGDIALIDPNSTASNEDIVLAQTGEEAMIKKYFRQGNRLRLVSENSRIKPITLHERYVKIVGKVVGIIRKF